MGENEELTHNLIAIRVLCIIFFRQKMLFLFFTVYKLRCVCNMPACLEIKKTQKRARTISILWSKHNTRRALICEECLPQFSLKNETYDVKIKKYIEHLYQMLTVLPNFPRPLNAMITKIQYLLTE